MKSVLICLEQLDIGGVETFAISQLNEFSRNGYRCFVLGKKGILNDKLKDISNVEFIDFEFTLSNHVDYEKIEYLIKKFLKIKIDFIIVHQFPCVLYILPLAFKLNIPYVAYLHSVIPKTCEWFMENYSIFKVLFPLYFKNASKIIPITDSVMKENQSLFNISKEKYLVVNNSIDFHSINNVSDGCVKKPLEKFLLVSRISHDKKSSICTAISFFKYYRDNYNKNAKLTVVGDGDIFTDVVNQYSEDDIYFKGKIVDVFSEMIAYDVVLGVDRCILEAIAVKKLAIICGYNEVVCFVTPENITEASSENFSGKNMETNIQEFVNYDEKELYDIVLNNYNYVFEKMSINVDIFSDIKKANYKIDFENIFFNLNLFCKRIDELEQKVSHYYNDGQRLYAIIDKQSKEIDELNYKNSLLIKKQNDKYTKKIINKLKKVYFKFRKAR